MTWKFKKGILFVKETKYKELIKIIKICGIKNVVIDAPSISRYQLNKINNEIQKNQGQLMLCNPITNIKQIKGNITLIENELQAFKLIVI